MWRLLCSLMLVSGLGLFASASDAPRPVPAQHAGVGRMARDFPATTVTGQPFRLSDFAPNYNAVVLVWTSTSCPVNKKYLPTLSRLEQEFRKKKVGFIYINPITTDKPEEMTNAIKEHALSGPYIHDKTESISKLFGAGSTGDVFLLDPKSTVVYRGAIDDQYGVGYSRSEAKHHYLRDAITAVLNNQTVAIRATEAPGCALDLSSVKEPSAEPITYHRQIERIVQNHCLECHRTGGVAPFTLATFQDVVSHKGMIRKVVERGVMPPWFAVDEKDVHGKWINDRSLTATEKSELLNWLNNGTPEGELRDAPIPLSFSKDWAIGKPDQVVKLPKPIAIKADGTMPYQNVTAETGLTEDRWVQAVEIRPTARAVVHHVLVFRITENEGGLLNRVREGTDDRAGFFAAYVPGNDHQVFPEGFAKKLPKGTKLRFQIHYTPNGTATEDQLEIGFVFAKKAPQYELRVVGLANPKISIPPGASDHVESATLRVPFDAVVLSFMPHLHLRGKACHYEMTTSSGEKVTLLNVPKYDFNWQLKYELAEPLRLPRGTALKFTAHFDNSDKNPANPDPSKAVRWGPQTYDEMLLGFIEYYLPTIGAK